MTVFFTRLISLAAVFAATLANAQEVRVYNWSDYIEPQVLKEFEDETGIKVIYDVFDSNAVLEAKLLTGASGYDVVMPSNAFLQRQIEIGVFGKLQLELLPNLVHAWPAITEQTQKFDPGNAYSVNYMWGSTGIGVNLNKVKAILGEDAKLNTMDLLFDPATSSRLADCGIYMLDAPDEVITLALKYLGEDPLSQDPKIIAKAQPLLAANRQNYRKFDSSEYINALANGDICLAMGWSGDVLQARERAREADNGVDLAYFTFAEGSLMGFDQMAIPADAPNPEAAHEFINFVMRPEINARIVNYVWFPSGNLAAQEFIAPAILADTAIYPDAQALKTLFVRQAWGPRAQRAATRLWTRAVTGS